MANNLIIVIPFYNEESRSLKNTAYWYDVFALQGIDYILVNDGSTDQTKLEIDKFASIFKNVKSFHKEKNSGKSSAIIQGMKMKSSSEASMIGFMDGDCAIQLEDLRNITEISRKILSSNEIGFQFESIWGSRVSLAGRNIQRTITRKWISRLLATIFGVVDGNLPYDTQCGLKVYLNSKELKEVLTLHKFRTKWFFDLELHLALEKIRKKRVEIWEEPLKQWADNSGSKLIQFKTLLQVPFEVGIVMSLLLKNQFDRKRILIK